MSDVVISVENISKEYRLGTVSHNTMRKDMESWWARMRGKEDPNALIDTTSNCSRYARVACG
jgi:lipopolysaccharide transport system ATP-binding protein